MPAVYKSSRAGLQPLHAAHPRLSAAPRRSLCRVCFRCHGGEHELASFLPWLAPRHVVGGLRARARVVRQRTPKMRSGRKLSVQPRAPAYGWAACSAAVPLNACGFKRSCASKLNQPLHAARRRRPRLFARPRRWLAVFASS
jgi:hypothetical protein